MVATYLAYVETVRAGRIHKIHAFDLIAIFIKTLRLIWEIFFSYWEFFHQNWEKYIYVFALGTGPFMGPGYVGRKIPDFSENTTDDVHE